MRTRSSSLFVGGLGACALALSLAACSADPAAAPSASPSATAAEPTTPAPTSPPPSAPAEAPLATCDTVLDEAGNADLAADGLTLREFVPQSWDYPRLVGMHEGGVVCMWGGGGDVIVIVGQLQMDEQTWDAARAELEASGYVPDDASGIEGFLNGPDGDDESYPGRGFAWRDGILYYASYPGILESVPAFQP